ncbi:ammonium transporter AmtB-like domain-containing protein [Lobosporangium transversale]|uniref:Ammonium transporter n=1 Tax=Lobosporangium transversale TaxID=64571 RepID=A0A1Y2GPE5_9FUNG|nr:ammonium transporter AmtB-like domain-containing protein [Lobosporangium transversale]ORZ17570.1 ammonium transporter AmtB-like domain-containing protein [Lobosporangium transversale]|eukprot:XP_021881957.1 ammonium transporter AmtB-like domain-containing protein [Lobosporangium transversale]
MPAPAAIGSEFNAGDIAWTLTSTALVWLMIPGIGYFYSGMARSKNALSLIMLSCCSVAVVSFQWFLFGYSLAFSKSGSKFIGNFENAFFRGVLGAPSVGSAKIPDLVFMIFQSMFAALTPALAIGAAAERGRIVPTLVFIFLWTTFVYDFIACWTWSSNGWSFVMGGLDFAGGTPVHISSGAAALAYAFVLGRRIGDRKDFRPHSMSNVVIGTCFIWFGWFGFNGGSALSANLRAAMACVVTNLSASTAGLTWVLMDYHHDRKLSVLGFCSGAVAGLVSITPASGYVSPGSSVAIGFLGAVACNLAVRLKHYLKYDDAFDVFAVHGVGGIVGNILTGVFAQASIAALDGVTVINGGWLDQNWIQVAYQLVDSAAGLGWSFCVTYLILIIMNKVPGLNLRAHSDHEHRGLDLAELGEACYDHLNEKAVNPNVEVGNAQGGVLTSEGLGQEIKAESSHP